MMQYEAELVKPGQKRFTVHYANIAVRAIVRCHTVSKEFFGPLSDGVRYYHLVLYMTGLDPFQAVDHSEAVQQRGLAGGAQACIVQCTHDTANGPYRLSLSNRRHVAPDSWRLALALRRE